LIHISKNIDKYHQNKSVGHLSRDDVCVVIRNLGNTELSFAQEYALSFVSTWLEQNRDEREPGEILKTINLQQINPNILTKALTSEGFRGNQAAHQYLERELAIKNGEDPNDISRGSVHRTSFVSDAKFKRTDGGEHLREPLKTNPSPVFLPRGRFMNQSYQNGEPDHPRHSSLQRDPTYRGGTHSLNTSLRSNEIPYVPKILGNRTLATETSPGPDMRRGGHEASAERDSALLRHGGPSGPNLGNLSYVDKRASLQTLYSPTGNIFGKNESAVNNPPQTEGKKTPMGMSVSTGREIFSGHGHAGHGVTNAGFMSAVTSPTYNKPDFSTMGSNSMHYQSNRDVVSPQLSEGPKSAGPKGNFSLSSSFNSSNLLRRGNDRRIMTESEDGVNVRPRDSSITRGTAGLGTVGSMAGRESYSNLGDYSSKYDRFERQTIEEVREYYPTLEKTPQEKIALIRRCLHREKDQMRMDVFSQVDVRMYLTNGKQQLFD
jgi:hypothetical protein